MDIQQGLPYEHLLISFIPFGGTALGTFLRCISYWPGVVALKAGDDSNTHWLPSLYAEKAHYFLNCALRINTSCKAIYSDQGALQGQLENSDLDSVLTMSLPSQGQGKNRIFTIDRNQRGNRKIGTKNLYTPG